MKPESELIDEVLQGDRRACRALYDRHVDGLFRFLMQFSRDGDEVQEWVQRSFIKAFKSISTFRREAKFTSWLFTIGMNEMRSDRRKNVLPLQGFDEARPESDAGADVPAETNEEFMWDDAMKRWLSELDEKKRAVFILYEVEGYSHAEIA